MNIDELRSAWQQQPATEVSESKWTAMLKQDSNNPIAKLKKRTRFEWIFGLALIVILGIVFTTIEKMPLAGLAYFVLAVYGYFYSKQQMKLIKQMEKLDGDVKHTIDQQVTSLQQFFNRHMLYAAVLGTCFLALMGWIIYKQTGELPIEDFPTTYPEAVLPYSGFLLGVGVVFYIIGRISIKIKYGKHLKQLRNKAAQLSNEL